MRTFFYRVGVFAVVVVVLIVAGIGYVAIHGSRLDREATDYSIEAVMAITGHWDQTELMARATPTLKKMTSPEKLATMFGWFQSLGALNGAPECASNAMMSARVGGENLVGARSICQAHYASGDATITLELQKHDGSWTVNGFNVNSAALIPKSNTQQKI